jgi:hypothetical protein
VVDVFPAVIDADTLRALPCVGLGVPPVIGDTMLLLSRAAFDSLRHCPAAQVEAALDPVDVVAPRNDVLGV